MKYNSGQFKKGQVSPRKGVVVSELSKEKMRLARLGKVPWNKGKKMSLEAIKKLSEAQKGCKKPPRTLEHRRKLSEAQKGERSHRWKGGLVNENDKLRNSLEYKLWRESVLERDNHICIWCGSKDKLEADHIKPFAYFPELRFAIDNGRTLCNPCHKSTNTYGGKIKYYDN